MTHHCTRCGVPVSEPGRRCIDCGMIRDLAHWQQGGACAEVDPELFHPLGWGDAYAEQIKAARDVCLRCPVRAVCLAGAMESRDKYAILGATTPAERESIRRKAARGRLKRTPPPINHGTPSGVEAHRRRGEKPCPRCSQAASVYRRGLRAARDRREGVA